VSDMTTFKFYIFYFEVTFYFDVFTKQILSWKLAERRDNRQRPCYAIGYDTPDNYYKRFMRGEIEKRDTFTKRIISEEPKFLQKRKMVQGNS